MTRCSRLRRRSIMNVRQQRATNLISKGKKKKHYSRIEYLCESIHPKKKIVSFKDLLCYDNQQKFKDKL